ncbi:hypothetical protein C4J85_3951 [Pseudomonas sp. R4-34-07]|uniref:hypothetical protein n=1 Tax=unclassified Pseudomonas TaxID=196821 RepID=UPI000F56ECA4|nr:MULTISPECIES: hypothetical protein [unclassified Pseudomonas]AZF22735.1 hypothetical protein C4J91_4002 [Pseudomonas sp. R3-52-08]AZF54419.1 hypothetical protein C4J85_3951 [Pseudomonas sp. R4-34-07]
MEKVDDLTREKLRDWQMRRLEIKDRIQSYPEQTLELSKVLDLMDDEHAEILSRAEIIRTAKSAPDVAIAGEEIQPPLQTAYTVELKVSACSAQDLRRLLDVAFYELQQQLEAKKTLVANDRRRYGGGMSGTLGDYNFELSIGGE